MTAPVHDRLTQIIREAWHRSRAWTPGVQLPAEEFADALLASEEWHAREAVVWKEAQRIADSWPAECLSGNGEQNCGPGLAEEFGRRAVLAEHSRLAAGKETES